MSGEVFTITDEQRDSVLNYEEGHFGDVKATKILPSKMSQSISAFSNTDGGELWVGISENSEKTVRTWRGFEKWLRKSEQGDKWNRCLIEGMIVLSETGARDEQTTPP